MKKSSVFLLPFIALFISENSQAAPIDVEFKGTVTSVFADPNPPPFAPDITSSLGTQFVGHYIFDPAATPFPNPAPTTGTTSYSITGLPYGINVNIGGALFSVDGLLNIGISNGIGGGVDQYTVFAQKGIAGGLNDYLSLQLFLEDSSGTVFNNTALTALTQTNINSFNLRSFFLDGVQTIDGTTYQFQVQGDVTSIPEPQSIQLIGLGVAVLTVSKYKRRTVY